MPPAFQRRGIGSRLLKAIEDQFPAVTRFELFTGSRSESNLRLYQRAGYRITRTKSLSPAASFFAMPFYVELNGDPVVWTAAEKPGLLRTTGGLLDYYGNQGVQKVDPKIEAILPTGKNRASVVLSWMLQGDQGTRWILDKSYQLVRDNNSWKIWACCGTET